MFEQLSQKLQTIFKKLHGEGHLTEAHIEKGLKEIKMVFLEADVNYKVVKDFIERIKVKAMGQEVLKSLTPAQQLIKIVKEELVNILGEESKPLNLKGSPAVFLLLGLQGSGKTTTAVKIGFKLKKDGKRVLLVPADTRRPAAMEQLVILAKNVQVPYIYLPEEKESLNIIKKGLEKAKEEAFEVMIVDSAGRLHIDEELMEEIKQIHKFLNPQEVLYVADSMLGQDALKSATLFNEATPLTGLILTKMDGDSRGGAALSIKETLKIPIRYIGIGEKVQDLEIFSPNRLAERILGMGDVLKLIEKAEEVVKKEEAEEMARKIKKEGFDLNDMLKQLKMIKKMGPITDLLKSLPLGGPFKNLSNVDIDDKILVKMEAILSSMTKEERENPKILNASRKKRIALGSGTTVQDINQLLRQFEEMQRMLKEFQRKKLF
jgi:signal recognition particle subunit SRP54